MNGTRRCVRYFTQVRVTFSPAVLIEVLLVHSIKVSSWQQRLDAGTNHFNRPMGTLFEHADKEQLDERDGTDCSARTRNDVPRGGEL